MCYHWRPKKTLQSRPVGVGNQDWIAEIAIITEKTWGGIKGLIEQALGERCGAQHLSPVREGGGVGRYKAQIRKAPISVWRVVALFRCKIKQKITALETGLSLERNRGF